MPFLHSLVPNLRDGEHVAQSLIEQDPRRPLEINARQRRVRHERRAVDSTDLRGIHDDRDRSLQNALQLMNDVPG